MSIGLLKDLYAPPSLKDLGERLSGQFTELSSRPTRDGCDQLLMSLTQAGNAVRQLRTKLERERAA